MWDVFIKMQLNMKIGQPKSDSGDTVWETLGWDVVI